MKRYMIVNVSGKAKMVAIIVSSPMATNINEIRLVEKSQIHFLKSL